MANHALPTTTDLYANVLTYLHARIDDASKWYDSALPYTNAPTGVVQWDSTALNWKKNTGTAGSPVWTVLSTAYNININGTVGATTPTTGAFTTLTTSGIAGLGANSTVGGNTIAHLGSAAQTFTGSMSFTNASPIISAKIGPASGQQHTLPAVTSDTLALIAATQTFTNKTYSGGVLGGTFTGNAILSGQITFNEATAPIITAKLGPSSTQQHTLPVVASDTIALLAATQTFTNKTLTSPSITGATLTGSAFNGTIGATTPSSGVFTTITSNNGYVQSPGLSTSWGVSSTTNTGAYNAVMGTGASATWLLSGTSGGVFRYGIQGLDAGSNLRLYAGTGWLHFDTINLTNSSGHTFVTSANYNSYAPTLTGTGASGSWNINASGLYNTPSISVGVTTITGGTTQPLKLITSSGGPWSIELNRSDLGLLSRVYNDNGSRWYFEHRPNFAGNVAIDAGNYNSYAPTLTGGGASGTWGINITGNAATATNGLTTGNYNSYAPTLTGTGASGTWGINITGSAPWGSLTSRPASIMYYQGFTLDANTMDSNSTGFTYALNAPYTGPIARFSAGGGYDLEINASYSGGTSIAFRTRNGDATTWNSWYAILNSANYTSWAPSLTGAGASGTWGINITGSAASATSATTSSYSTYLWSTSHNGTYYVSNAWDGTYWNFTSNHGAGIRVAYSDTVAINYNNDSNSTYQMLWGSSTSVYGTAGITCNPSTDQLNVGILYSSGNVTAYSDERVKTNWRSLGTDFIFNLAQVKSGVYDRTDITLTQVGVSAQSLRNVIPAAVDEDKDGKLSVSYGHAALASSIELAKKVVELENKLEIILALLDTKLIKGE